MNIAEKRKQIREVIDTYTDDGCLFPDRSCSALGSGYCSSSEESYKCLMQRLSDLGCVIKLGDDVEIEMTDGAMIPRFAEYEPLIEE